MADDAAWQAAMDLLLKASRAESREASLSAAEDIRARTRALLSAKTHPEHTFSPSAPGEPPASISFDLVTSISAQMVGLDEAWVGPTGGYGRTEFYARIQELSGDMHGHPYMHFFADGIWWARRFIHLPERPYLKPATDDAVDSGQVWDYYAGHQLIAIMEATG